MLFSSPGFQTIKTYEHKHTVRVSSYSVNLYGVEVITHLQPKYEREIQTW